MTAYNHLLPLIDRLSGRRCIVIGDVILDEYLIGRTDRLSREAPIPVLEFERRDLIPGGATNPSINIAALGSMPIQVGVIGDDENAKVITALLAARGADPSGLIRDPSRPTTTKTRILAHMGLRFPQQVARIDRLDRRPVNGEVEQAILAQIRDQTEQAEALVVSDYLTGLLTDAVVAATLEASRRRGILSIADAQGELRKYRGFGVIKCNADEAMRHARRELQTDEDFAAAGRTIVEDLQLDGGMLITRGPDGMTVIRPAGTAVHVPAPHVEDVYDTVGAGDTVLAVVTLALIAGASLVDAATLANLAAGIVVRKVGNYAPSPHELRNIVKEQAETPLG